VALLCAAGCSDGDGGEGGRTPVQQCQDMVDTYCAKVSDCAPASDRVDRGAGCETSLSLQQHCERVVAVEGSMSDCLKSLDAIDCHSYDPTKETPAWPDACAVLAQ
jgi:hypothetical protein